MVDIKTKIIFSIPGRIRIKVFNSIKNDKLGNSISSFIENIKGIDFASFNKNTGNILIIYKCDYVKEAEIINKINEFKFNQIKPDIVLSNKTINPNDIVLNSMNPFNLFKKKHPIKIFKNEYNISKNLFKTGLVLGILSLVFTFNIRTLFSILILTYPGIIFTISSIVHYYSIKKAFYNNIDIKNIYNLKALDSVDSVLIDSNLLLSKDTFIHDSLMKDEDMNKLKILRLLSLEKMEDPLNSNIRTVIKNIRNYGFIDLVIFSNKKDSILDYVESSLGIEVKEYNYIKESLKFSKDTMIIVSNNHIKELKNFNKNLIIYVYKDGKYDFEDADISLSYEDISKIPWLINLNKYSNEIILRRQISAVAINTIGMFLASIRFLNPFSSLGLYILNTLSQITIAKNEIKKQGVVYD